MQQAKLKCRGKFDTWVVWYLVPKRPSSNCQYSNSMEESAWVKGSDVCPSVTQARVCIHTLRKFHVFLTLFIAFGWIFGHSFYGIITIFCSVWNKIFCRKILRLQGSVARQVLPMPLMTQVWFCSIIFVFVWINFKNGDFARN